MSGPAPRARASALVLADESQVGAGFRARVEPYADVSFALTEPELRAALPGADVLLAWDYGALGLVGQVWDAAERLEWIQMSGIGIDGIVCPQLAASDVVLTNVRGVTEGPIAEYVLGAFLFWAKDMARTVELQAERRWLHRETETLVGRRVTVLGAGGVGRAIAALLAAARMDVRLVARGGRPDPDFGEVIAIDRLDELLPETEFLVVALPLTAGSRGLLDARRLALLPAGARLVNIGRGQIVDDLALISALGSGRLAAAALDVFEQEPLPADHPLWGTPNALITAHMAGDIRGWQEAVAEHFVANLRRFLAGRPLENVVDPVWT